MVPAVVMSLGWGLRGYIGGGPLGAMIPGVLVTLVLCLRLERSPAATALVAALGTIAISFGGDMTYGQTIGFVRSNDTLAWGWLGLGLKGAVWGLLGGAVLGLGFVAHRLRFRDVLAALVCLLVAAIIGIAVINEPKLIYFSNRLDKPRDESWAGLLFGALAFLAWLSARHPTVASIPRRFAAWGTLGGGIGFAGGAAWIILGSRLGPDAQWIPWWKFMEFSFGFIFGAALGLCAYSLRDRLRADEPAIAPSTPKRFATLSFSLLLIAATLIVWPLVGALVARSLEGAPSPWLLTPMGRVLLGSTGLGCLLILLSLRSETVAWNVSVTIPFVASVIDLERDWTGDGNIEVHAALRWGLVIVCALVAADALTRWQRKPHRRLSTLVLTAMWAFVAVAAGRVLSDPNLLIPTQDKIEAAGGFVNHIYLSMRSEAVVHAIFFATAVLGTVGIMHAEARASR